MVPKHSFLQQISSCLISTVPEKFYDKVEEGSIILKKATNFSFCKQGVLVNGDTQPLATDLVILATGYRGDKKLKDIFVSSTFKDYIAGSPNTTVPLYRLVSFLKLNIIIQWCIEKVTTENKEMISWNVSGNAFIREFHN